MHTSALRVRTLTTVAQGTLRVVMADFQSRTGSSKGVFKRNGEVMAVSHPVMPKSYAGNADAGNLTAARCGNQRMQLNRGTLAVEPVPLASRSRLRPSRAPLRAPPACSLMLTNVFLPVAIRCAAR